MKIISSVHNFRRLLLWSTLGLLVLWPYGTFGQTRLLEDKETSGLILQAMDSVYNLNFHAADKLIEKIEQRIHQHPGVFLLKAFLIKQKNMPLHYGSAEYGQFKQLLFRSIEESKKLLDKDENDVEGIFFSLASHGYLAQLYAENNKNLYAASEAKYAYDFIKPGFDLINVFPDFYFPCGLYDYYREAYPELHPYYKTVVWLFRSGDKKLGIEMLKKGSETALFTRTESIAYLGHIYLRYEDNPKQSLPYTEKLIRLYPHNLVYSIMYVENLIMLKKYFHALSYIEHLKTSDKDYYRYVGEIFYGNYLEATLSDLNGALNAYRIAEKIASAEDLRIPHFESMLYLGLGRINKKMGNVKTARDFFKKALETAVYPAQQKEAEAFLD